jgi:DnaK suppressor protein
MEPSAELVADEERTRLGIVDLEADLAGIAESTALVPDDEHDAEGSTVGYERARVTALLLNARHHLDALHLAIDRVQRGDAGHCDHCGAVIPAERLAALPTARLCMPCSTPRRSGMFGRAL